MSHSKSLRETAWNKCQGICFLCGYPMYLDPTSGPLMFTIEHIIPKCRKGTNHIDNISGSHQFCNNMKQDSLMEELPSGFRKVIRWKIRHLVANQKV